MKTGVNKKILVVDDDIAILDVIKIILEDQFAHRRALHAADD